MLPLWSKLVTVFCHVQRQCQMRIIKFSYSLIANKSVKNNGADFHYYVNCLIICTRKKSPRGSCTRELITNFGDIHRHCPLGCRAEKFIGYTIITLYKYRPHYNCTVSQNIGLLIPCDVLNNRTCY